MQKPKSHIFNSSKGLVVWMSMRIWLRGAESLSYWRVGLRSKESRIPGGGREGRFLLTLSCLGCFWLCLAAMPKSCFDILKGGELEGTVNKYYGGDIVGGVFSWWRAKTPPTTECFLPGIMVNLVLPSLPLPHCVLHFATTSGHLVRAPSVTPFLWPTLSLVGQH